VVKDMLAAAVAAVNSPVAVWRLFVLFVVGGHIAWACGLIPGIRGFALANEVDEKIAQLDHRLSAIETKQDIALRIALADEICRLYSLRAANTANPDLWRTLNETFNQRQENYRAVNNGADYDVGQCSAPR
jgi:hypothetical protein